MGAENSILEGCEWGDPVDCPTSFPWKLTPITKHDGNDATVFEPKNTEKKDRDLLRKAAMTMKSIRHPNIVRYIDSGESPDSFWLATESVMPLLTSVPSMTSDELVVGLHDIVVGLQFLHEKLGMCLNNVCAQSVYVGPDGVWKLGGLEHACKFSQATQDFLDRCRAFRVEDSLAPEEKSNNVKAGGCKGHERDVYSLGVLVDTLTDLVEDKDSLYHTIVQQFSSCVNGDPSSRPSTEQLLKLSIFKSDLLDIICGLRNIAIKTDTEKKVFFSGLVPRLQSLPPTVIARRLVIPLLARFVLLDEFAHTLVLPHLLTPVPDDESSPTRKAVPTRQGLLSESLFKQYVTDHLFKILRVHDCHIRLVLLKHFSHYVHLFSKEQLTGSVFVEILYGLRDSDDRLVEATLRALADLVPLMGGDVVIGSNRKTFFFHGMPKQVSPEDLKDLPRNVNSAMAGAKPLLRDLAAGGRSAMLSEEEKQRKLLEREQRREEARLKREERKRRLKEKQLESDPGEGSKGENGPAGLTIEQVASLDFKLDDSLSKMSLASDTSNLPEAEQTKVSENTDERSASEPDWSDWENTSDGELQDLPDFGGGAGEEGGGKVQTSPSPYRSHTPSPPPQVRVDWSDVPDEGGVSVTTSRSIYSEGGKKLTLKPKAHHGTSEVSEDGEGLSESWPDQEETWESTNSVQAQANVLNSSGNSLKLKAASKASKSQGKTSAAPAKKAGREDDFGFGYDIKSIEIVAKSEPAETDFFADMAPSLPESKTDIFSAIVDGGPQNASNGTKSLVEREDLAVSSSNSAATMFAAMDAGDPTEESPGWGNDEDMDWGNEDF